MRKQLFDNNFIMIYQFILQIAITKKLQFFLKS